MHLGVSQTAVMSFAAEIEVELAYVSKSVFDGSDGIVNASKTGREEEFNYFLRDQDFPQPDTRK